MDELKLKLQEIVNAIQCNGVDELVRLLTGTGGYVCPQPGSPIETIKRIDIEMRNLSCNMDRIATALENLTKHMGADF